MVICVCNNLNEEAVKDVLASDGSVESVHSSCGCKVKCGKCLETIDSMCIEMKKNKGSILKDLL